MGDPGSCPEGFVGAFYQALNRRPLRHRASTYRKLILIGYAFACLELALLAVMYREPWDVAWTLYGMAAGGSVGALTVLVDAALLRDRPKREWAVRLGFGGTLYLWLKLYVEPMMDTREGEFILVGVLLGVTLGLALPGNIYYRYKLAVERADEGRPAPERDEWAERMEALAEAVCQEERRVLIRGNLLKASAVAIGASAGIMIWAATDMAVDPEFDTLTGIAVWYPLMGAALVALLLGLVRGECRLMLIAGTLAGFSFLGPLAVAGQLLLWADHRRFGLPWKAGDGDDAARRLEERWTAEMRAFREATAGRFRDLGVMLEVWGPRPNIIQKEASLMRRDLERVEVLLLALPKEDPRGEAGRLERVAGLIEVAKRIESSDLFRNDSLL
ncbi:MAG: hypothetical protein AB1793_01945 [Candidatus Thermoplasmatota archaeon]